MRTTISLVALAALAAGGRAEPVTTAAALAAAVADAKPGTAIALAAGTYELTKPLELKSGTTLTGAGMDLTTITHAAGWKPSTETLPDPEMTTKGMDTGSFLIRLPDDSKGVTVRGLTLRAPQLHGAVYAKGVRNLTLDRVRVQDTLWVGVRTFSMTHSTIRDCEFTDAGGRWERGRPGTKGGITGGAIFAVYTEDCEIANNRFTRTRPAREHEFYGIKGRLARRVRIHHNTINVNFAIEFPFENDEDVEIDHNVCSGTISIPKYAGGPVPKGGRTFHLHHNWLRDSYAVEFVRNGVEIDHNLFDFDREKDHGNLISAFGKAPAKGPASFHDNLVHNPGLGVIWMNEVFNNLKVHNNHVICLETATPRKDGLFGFNPKCDFKTIEIRDNVIECVGPARPLVRNTESLHAVIVNNKLTNVSDSAKYANPQTAAPAGLREPLKFACGVNGEVAVDGWKAGAK